MYIKTKLVDFLNEQKQQSNDEIQLYIDIIDSLPDNDPKRDKYIDLLKQKYGYDYIKPNDEYLIENADINDLKTLDDFKMYSNFKKYAKRILELREINIDYSKFYKYGHITLNRDELSQFLLKYAIKSEFINGSISNATLLKDYKTIRWAGEVFDIYHILHEIAHQFNKEIQIPITYSLTDYGLTNQDECGADNTMLYFLNPDYFKQILPEIGNYIEKSLPSWAIRLSDDIKNVRN